VEIVGSGNTYQIDNSMPLPILYTFSGVGSGTLGNSAFQNATFAISVLTDATNVYNPINLFPQGASQVDCSTQSVAVSIAGQPTAVIGLGLNVTLMNDPQHNLFWISIGEAPDQLVVVNNPGLRHYNLKAGSAPVVGIGAIPVSQRSYPLTAIPQALLFNSITKAEFQATLLPKV
jgi:hypothetical protein